MRDIQRFFYFRELSASAIYTSVPVISEHDYLETTKKHFIIWVQIPTNRVIGRVDDLFNAVNDCFGIAFYVL
jgi:hypothetical protein